MFVKHDGVVLEYAPKFFNTIPSKGRIESSSPWMQANLVTTSNASTTMGVMSCEFWSRSWKERLLPVSLCWIPWSGVNLLPCYGDAQAAPLICPRGEEQRPHINNQHQCPLWKWIRQLHPANILTTERPWARNNQWSHLWVTDPQKLWEIINVFQVTRFCGNLLLSNR